MTCARALEWEKKALAIREKKLGKEHPDTAISYNNMGLIYADTGDKHQAISWFQKALEINEKMLGKEHPTAIKTYRNLKELELSNASDSGKVLAVQ